MTKEDIRMISWTIEISTFIVATAVIYLIWRISKNASDKRKREQHNKED